MTVNEARYSEGEDDGSLFVPDVMLDPGVEPEGEEHSGQLGWQAVQQGARCIGRHNGAAGAFTHNKNFPVQRRRF